ncbi:valine--tRNA ligase [Desulfuromonas acetoxidans]|uniref:Valine--tRNA ligase n=1 Tax=Desulfuromonas acetoxidans (strain DSM 684 / 11070) TaxID=281689 RepID=Q1JZ32_DESA6|nr:valine--tRNA ligase [Desulfuromonas acetoxidans]EAT15462.1 valyl-tRNA synthetase [Desulfuromonas acetoxidans DSM 684]MBF0646985.1 valine--tRNA ligase [Desulfuromonas acetoxidans]NVD25884.1 valine--tRNA ligase [Desulfuromonas acetoxidans]NVE17818.1 valine--tRNA ligase [Desulfuromonas acetoxidans]
MADELAKGYEPHDFETKWYQTWEENGYFHADENSDKPPYSIVIPPPNVTGVLHMGHALNNTMQDILARWKRMTGHEVLWMPGTDHAGIATQNVVEKQLASEDKDRHDVGRDAFIERVWQWREESGGQIINQLKRLGASCDWQRERFTMDDGLSKAVREVFVSLYEEGLIYRDNRLINWCPRCHTALSDLEVEHDDKKGNLWHLRYPVKGTDQVLVVATTRPETMLGDTAVAVHPDDERYADLVGKMIELPLTGREIPIIADDYVDKEFGSGAVKITPAHDFNDFEMGKRHNLENINILDESGFVNENGGAYQGMERYAAREKVVADLDALGLLEKVDDHLNSVGECYRCKTVIEPYMSLQWYVDVQPLAKEAIKAVESGQTRIVPAQWEKTYYEWMYNIQDWCISRQIWWGHRIPAWFCDDCGEITVSRDDATCCAKCQSTNIHQETDVLDTWFSSGLWPFSTMGWPEKTDALNKFYPTSCLITGFDILFFWVARMMMMGLKFMGEVPFKDVYIHALVRDAQGQKMSKSKGNVIDPLTVIDEFGTDAFRFTLTAFAAQGRDVKLSTERIGGYRNFCNKLWNASRFTLMNLEGFEPVDTPNWDELSLSMADRWILTRLTEVEKEANKALEEYRFNEAASTLYTFTWHEFCDWYIELIKGALYGDDAAAKLSAQTVVYTVLERLLRLLHPITPFITEEIWQNLPGTRPVASIMLADYPQGQGLLQDEDATAKMEQVMEVVRSIRNIRGEMDVSPAKKISALLDCKNEASLAVMSDGEEYIKALARIEELTCGVALDQPAQVAKQVSGDVEILLPLAGLINVEEEEKRLTKEIAKVQKDVDMFSKKLANEKFVANAPAAVLEKDRGKLAAAQEKLTVLQASLEKIVALK